MWSMEKAKILFAIVVTLTFSIFVMTRPVPLRKWPVNDSKKQLIVLGFDGVDPTLLEQYTKEGMLPNIKSMMDSGTYSKLSTTTPAQSPVAWSSFSTGTNPGKHDVMDFIIRDPKTYTPSIGVIGSKDNLIGKPTITNTQKGDTFWDILSVNGLKSNIIKVPVTFPAKPLNGNLLSGLGTPDALGTIGTFQYFTTENTSYIDNDQAYTLVTLEDKETINTKIKGPKNTSTSLTIKRNFDSVELNVGGKKITLNNNQWSDYINIDFNLLGPFYKERGIAKLYLIQSEPVLKLYLSPISFDPKDPFYNISYPSDFSKTLAKENGLFKTLGFSTDLWALKEERISEDVFITDLNNSLEEEKKILKSELTKDGWNTYVQVFQAPDLAQHMFYRYIDPSHPRYEANSKYQNTIRETYQKMDQIIGETKASMPKDATLIIMSDHGFSPYRKSVDLNSWLYDNGYLALKDPTKRSDFLNNFTTNKENFWSNIDWSKTKAYGLGLGSLYINLEGREGEGIVTDEEYVNVRNEIRDKLLKLEDNGTKVVANVYKREDIMYGPYLYDAADLIVGFNEGYRISWQTTFGSVPTNTIFPNNSKFSGDHCSVDPSLIPGIFLMNAKTNATGIGITDIAPSILNYFGIEKPFDMDGKIISF
jgi:predicted AlkP superfamily phosphohydrolase/phosphomutase